MLLTSKELQRSPLFQTRSYMQSYSVASICVLFEVAVIFLIMFIKLWMSDWYAVTCNVI